MTRGTAAARVATATLGLIALAGCGWATAGIVAAVAAGSGGGSSSSPPEGDTTPPNFIGAISANATSPWSIRIGWTAATDNVTPSADIVYLVYHSLTFGGHVLTSPPMYVTSPGVTSFDAGGLTPGTAHYFVVRARDAAGNVDPNTSQVTVGTPAAPTAGWTSVASMGALRRGLTASLMPDGRVLVAGGDNGTSNLATAEIYDPESGAWAGAAPMGSARYLHAALPLPDGRILMTGGEDVTSTVIASAERYDPGGNTWLTTPAMASTRRTHTMTLLQNGTVLVAGGLNSSGSSIASCEIYLPGTNSWAATGGMMTARHYHTATLLPSGLVLVAGGFSNGPVTAAAEIYNPTTGLWTNVNGMGAVRAYHSATLLPDGTVLVAGDRNFSATAEVFTPATGLWAATPALPIGRGLHSATLLPNGQVLVMGGNTTTPTATADLFDPISGQWTATGGAVSARAEHVAVLLPSGQVLAIGGQGTSARLSAAETYDFAAGADSWSGTGGFTGARNGPRAVALPSGDVLIAGGDPSGAGTSASAATAVYGAATGAWTASGPMGTARRALTTNLLPNGDVIATGGQNGGSYYSTAETWSPASGSWSSAGTFAGTPALARYHHTGTVLATGDLLVAGGLDGSTTHSNVQLYSPAAGTWLTLTAMTTARNSHTATRLPDGRVVVIGGHNGSYVGSAELYDPATGTWTTAVGALGTARSQHASALLPSGQILVVGGFNAGTLSSAELFDPATGMFSATGNSLSGPKGQMPVMLMPDGHVLVPGGLNGGTYASTVDRYDPATSLFSTVASLATSARAYHMASLLTDGRLLVAGGNGGAGVVATADIRVDGTGVSDSWRPRIDAIDGVGTFPQTLAYGSTVTIAGARFRGISEASTGSYSSSPSDIPVVTLSGPLGVTSGYVESGAGITYTLPAISFAAGSSCTATLPTQYHPTANPTGLGAGYYHLRVTANGIPSDARIVRFGTSGLASGSFGTAGVVTNDPNATFNDHPFGAVTSGGNLYVVGFDNTSGVQWRIEARSAATGALDTTFNGTGVVNSNAGGGWARACVTAGTNLYIAGDDGGGTGGQWRIEARSLATGVLDTGFNVTGILQHDPSPSGGADVVHALWAGATNLFVVGMDASPTNPHWRIQARSLATGALDTNFGTGGNVTSQPGAGTDVPYAVWADGTDLFIVGTDTSGANTQWRIEKRSMTTGSLDGTFSSGTGIAQSNPTSGTDVPRAIVGANGFIYVFGEENTNAAWRIEKRSTTTGALDASFGSGGIVSNSVGVGQARGLWTDGTYLYAGGSDNSPGNEQWRIEKRDLVTGALVPDFGIGGVLQHNPSGAVDYINGITASATHFFVYGPDNIPGQVQWRMEAYQR